MSDSKNKRNRDEKNPVSAGANVEAPPPKKARSTSVRDIVLEKKQRDRLASTAPVPSHARFLVAFPGCDDSAPISSLTLVESTAAGLDDETQRRWLALLMDELCAANQLLCEELRNLHTRLMEVGRSPTLGDVLSDCCFVSESTLDQASEGESDNE